MTFPIFFFFGLFLLSLPLLLLLLVLIESIYHNLSATSTSHVNTHRCHFPIFLKIPKLQPPQLMYFLFRGTSTVYFATLLSIVYAWINILFILFHC